MTAHTRAAMVRALTAQGMEESDAQHVVGNALSHYVEGAAEAVMNHARAKRLPWTWLQSEQWAWVMLMAHEDAHEALAARRTDRDEMEGAAE